MYFLLRMSLFPLQDGETSQVKPLTSRKLVVFSGGSAANNLVDVFNEAIDNHVCSLTYIIPISDNGGSSSELIRVFGGPGIGDVRSKRLFFSPQYVSYRCTRIRFSPSFVKKVFYISLFLSKILRVHIVTILPRIVKIVTTNHLPQAGWSDSFPLPICPSALSSTTASQPPLPSPPQSFRPS